LTQGANPSAADCCSAADGATRPAARRLLGLIDGSTKARAVSLVTRGWSRSLRLQGSGSAAIEDGWLSDRGLLLAFPC